MGNSPKVDGHAATRRVRLSALRRNNEKLAKVDVFVPESSSFANFLLFAWTTSLHTALPHEVERCGRVWAHAHTISVEAVRIGVMMPSYAILCGQILVCSKMKSGDARGGGAPHEATLVARFPNQLLDCCPGNTPKVSNWSRVRPKSDRTLMEIASRVCNRHSGRSRPTLTSDPNRWFSDL